MAHSTSQSNDSFNEISQLIWKHLEERDWQHSPAKDIAISISLEANELLEHYQWSDSSPTDTEAIAAELADVMIYAFQFAGLHHIDVAAAIRKKLAKSAEKYPAEQFKGKERADRRQAWLEAKARYKKENA